MDTSDYGLTHPFKGPRAIADSLTCIQHELMKWLFIFNSMWIY